MNLSFNAFAQIPDVIFDLISLSSLDMFECKLREIPENILHLKQLTKFLFSGNNIESPPLEVAQKGFEAVRDYWRQRSETGVDYLCEAKLILLGEPGAGKTSLAHKIENPNFMLSSSEKSTEGIDVIHYEFPTTIRIREAGKETNLKCDFRVNIWDFGGQEIYHATHQFFLTRRSVYILVCDDRKEDTDFSYWLRIVEMLSDSSPLLIVQNEKQDRTRDISVGSLRAQFTNLRNALATNLDTNRGLDQIIQAIQHELSNLPHIGIGLPATWKRVREVLEKNTQDFISLNNFLKICQQYGFTRDEDKLQLSGYLHDLGICLHFQEDPILKNTVILKPSWGTDAVYRVLDDREVIEALGHFDKSQLTRIWSEKKYEHMHDELLRLMMKFQLCYQLEAEQIYIAPQLLSSEQPLYPWESNQGMAVRYEYEFMPKGIMTRFIVALHHLIAGGKLVWKTGVVLEKDGSRAEIIEEYNQRRIRVRITGPGAYGLLMIVDDQLERLHKSFPRLSYERYLPCPCSECHDKPEAYRFALKGLINMAKKGLEIQCHDSGEMVNAAELVKKVLPAALHGDGHNNYVQAMTNIPDALTPGIAEVFVSYAWNDESCAIVDRLQHVLVQQNICLLRDREEVRYKDSIREFMRRLGRSKCIVVIISEKYLKSENCMFELIEVASNTALRERIFPIVLSDANIYRAVGRIKYVQHWENEIKELDEALKTVRSDNLVKLQENLNIYSKIRGMFDDIAETLRDMNALTTEQHQDSDFDQLIKKIQAKLAS